MSEEEIISKFISIDENDGPTIGKYSSIKQSFYEDIKSWQSNKDIIKYDIKPLQFTFEITNKCNCNCKDCGMAANRLDVKRVKLKFDDLIKLSKDLYDIGIPAYAITGGEPFLEFDLMCEMIKHSSGKIDVCKIISNGFWGKNPKKYFDELEKAGLFKNKFFVPNIQLSIGEQTVDLECICNIMHYVSENYDKDKLHLGIIHTREKGLEVSKLRLLYEKYTEKYGTFPLNRFYLTNSYYVNSNPVSSEKLDVPTESVYNMISLCDNRHEQKIGTFVSPKIFMKCNGDCYPCEVFNLHDAIFLGNYFKIGLKGILDNYNSNKYSRFIKDYGTESFKNVIPDDILKKNRCETPCQACEFCIKFCEKNNLIR